MESIITNLFVFCIVLIIYIHIIQHTKQSSELEIYELENEHLHQLNEILESLQPTLFEIQCDDSFTNKEIASCYHSFEIKVRDKNDLQSFDLLNNNHSELFLPIVFDDCMKLFQNNSKSNNYFSENNQEFLIETGLIKKLRNYDEVLRPPLVCYTYYDILFAPKSLVTPLRFHLNYRHFILVTEGCLKIRMTPPKNEKYLNPIYDYENMEFRSLVDLWKTNEDFHPKVKCMEIDIEKGKIIYIPPFWWYTCRFETQNTTVVTFSYRTYLNKLTIAPYLFISMLQNHNVKRILSKTIDTEETFISDNSTSSSFVTSSSLPHSSTASTSFDFHKLKTI